MPRIGDKNVQTDILACSDYVDTPPIGKKGGGISDGRFAEVPSSKPYPLPRITVIALCLMRSGLLTAVYGYLKIAAALSISSGQNTNRHLASGDETEP
jgi:hypothetical protein